jgi:hypothetical protein
MNYINRLQQDLANANARIAAMETAVKDFQIALAGDKFKGFDASTGERKDWISTSETQRHLQNILNAGM